MRRRNVTLLAAAILFFSLIVNAQAQQMNRVAFNVWTKNYSNPAQQQVAFYVEVYANTRAHPPDIVKTITITAPDGSILSLDPAKDWLYPSDPNFHKNFYASDFITGIIPSGTYKVKVVPISGNSITESDTINAHFLPLATITYPTNNATSVTAMPTFTWTAVAGAAYYRILLWNNTWNQPVYWDFDSSMVMHTDFTNFTIPKGALKPNLQYRLRIQARAGSQDVDERSESDWVTFTTGSW